MEVEEVNVYVYPFLFLLVIILRIGDAELRNFAIFTMSGIVGIASFFAIGFAVMTAIS
jgi:hypothetical protein